MAHVRDQLLDAIVAVLTGLTTTGARVYRSRPSEYTLQPATQLPALRIFLLGDQASALGIGIPLLERTTSVRIEGVVKVTTGLDKPLNLISSEVETALGPALTLATGHTTQLMYRGCTFSDSGAGDQPIGEIAMTYEAIIYTNQGAPDSSLEA